MKEPKPRARADAVRGENARFFPELRHRVAKALRVLAYDSGGAALPELLRPGKDGCVPWLVAALADRSTHWCQRCRAAVTPCTAVTRVHNVKHVRLRLSVWASQLPRHPGSTVFCVPA